MVSSLEGSFVFCDSYLNNMGSAAIDQLFVVVLYVIDNVCLENEGCG